MFSLCFHTKHIKEKNFIDGVEKSAFKATYLFSVTAYRNICFAESYFRSTLMSAWMYLDIKIDLTHLKT